MSADESIFLLSEKQRAYFQRIKAEIFKKLQAEGIDTNYGFTVEEDTLQRIAGTLTNKPATAYKKAHRAATEPSFSLMFADVKTMPLDEYLKSFPGATWETVKAERKFIFAPPDPQRERYNPKEPKLEYIRVLYRECFYLRSDKPGFPKTPHLIQIFPGTAAYRIMTDGDPLADESKLTRKEDGSTRIQITRRSTREITPEMLEELRDALGLSGFRYITLSDHADLLFLDSFLKAAAEAQEQPAALTPKVFATPTEKQEWPVDKINNSLWGLLSRQYENGQIGIDMEANTGKKGNKKEAIVYAGIIFDESDGVKITKQLDPFDKRVYYAAGGLLNGGNPIFSASQLYRNITGSEGQPSSADIQRINASLDKMGTARLYIDSTEESKVNKGYKVFKYDAPLLPFERIAAYIDNTLCEVAIHLFREPPLLTFAKERKQVTTIPLKVLASPLSKTTANLILEDYLLERIGRMKSPKGNANRKINYATVYEKCHITTAKQKQRTPEKIKKYLEHYKKCAWITDYKADKDGFLITP